MCLQATVKASNIWSFVSYCWLFHYLCNSLCLSAQLCYLPAEPLCSPPSLSLRTTHLRCTFFLCPPFTYSHTHRIASSLSHYITPFFSFFLFFLAPYSLSTSSPSIYTDNTSFWASKLDCVSSPHALSIFTSNYFVPLHQCHHPN